MIKRRNDRVDISVLSSQTGEASLWRLVYVSDAKPRFTDDELNQILQSSRLNNFFTHDVTGMLMLAGGSF
nr:BLUF domain-containing protein [Rhodoglobus sp.]